MSARRLTLAVGTRGRPGERGAALLVAIVAIAVLTALAVDLAYQTQVRLRIAAAGRDELRAQALAQSGVTLSRLVLGFQAQVDGATQTLGQAAAQLAGQAGGQGAGGAAPAIPRIQIWNAVPVGAALADALFPPDEGGAPAPAAPEKKAPEGAAAVAAAPLADFLGGFETKIEDEGQKLNVQLDSQFTSGVLATQVQALLRLACEARWDPLFDRTDADGQRYSRTDLVQHLHDWVDPGNTTSALTATFPAGNCSAVVPTNGNPFETGFGDKNFPYDRGEDRYKTKNARMDSLDELHLVAGVTDAFLAAFGDQLTAYLPKNLGLNVNSSELRQQFIIAALMADPTSYPALLDPRFLPALHKALAEVTMGGFLSITATQFKQIEEGLGVKTKSLDLSAQNTTSPFSDKASMVFKIRATGRANDVTHAIEAVVTFDPNQTRTFDASGQGVQPAAQQGQLSTGRLIRWREE